MKPFASDEWYLMMADFEKDCEVSAGLPLTPCRIKGTLEIINKKEQELAKEMEDCLREELTFTSRFIGVMPVEFIEVTITVDRPENTLKSEELTFSGELLREEEAPMLPSKPQLSNFWKKYED